jgi:hypothetical protein
MSYGAQKRMQESEKHTESAALLPVNRHFLDYYRCPEAYATYQVSGPLSADCGYFCWDQDTICYGRTAGGARATTAEAITYNAQLDLNSNGPVSLLPFDPQEVTENLLRERYAAHFRDPGRLSHSIIRKLYYAARPYLGVAIRKHLQKVHLRNWNKLSFPEWPVDSTVDRLHQKLLALGMRAQGADKVPFIWFWPDGHKSCAIVTHDVEDLEGKSFCGQLMDIDESYGFRSSFQIVPEVRYPVEAGFLESITSRGFEVNIHDLNHDGRLFAERDEFLRRAKRINQYARDFQAVGFRSGILYRNADWYDAFEFQYDMSIPSVGHLDPQRGGCCTVMPYFIGNLVEIPVTCTQDYTLFHILQDYSIGLWKEQIERVMARNGLMSILVHPDYIIESRARKVYQALLSYLVDVRNRERIWTPLPRELAEWWQLRSRMRLVHKDGDWQVEGPGKEHARVAYASVAEGALNYSLRDENAQIAMQD